jgi:hypothetical protein
MKLYSVFIKKNDSKKVEDIALIKEGFSFAALLFSNFWFLYHKMWREFFVLALVNFVFVYFFTLLPDFDKVFLQAAFVFIVALNANYWLCEGLKKKNYQFVGLVFGSDLTSAKIRFLENLQADCTEHDFELYQLKIS